MKPMNQRVQHLTVTGYEVGAAYQKSVEDILAHPELSKYRYMLTLEDDNLPPPDGLLKLYESIEKGPYAAVGGLYWTKGYGGQPMIYGKPFGAIDFVPQLPRPDTIQECNGLGMGFTLFRLEVFRKIDPPWFKTLQEYDPAHGGRMMTQDLYFFEKVRKAGYKVACDTRVKVGHYDHAGSYGPPQFVW
jgi:GT2 family glycosyltransferase